MDSFPQRPFSVSQSEYPFEPHWFERNDAIMHYISEKWLASIESRLHLLAEKPVELVWAMGDPFFGKEEFIARWKSYLSEAVVDRVPGVGHYLQEESPDRVVAGIQRILDRQKKG